VFSTRNSKTSRLTGNQVSPKKPSPLLPLRRHPLLVSQALFHITRPISQAVQVFSLLNLPPHLRQVLTNALQDLPLVRRPRPAPPLRTRVPHLRELPARISSAPLLLMARRPRRRHRVMRLSLRAPFVLMPGCLSWLLPSLR
jgi:hypothetical protein